MMPQTPYEQLGTKAVFPLIFFVELGLTCAFKVSLCSIVVSDTRS
jgi:hypothetical protein